MAHQKRKKARRRKKSTVKRLFVANLVALLGLLTVTVVTLFCLGLLDSIFAFIF